MAAGTWVTPFSNRIFTSMTVIISIPCVLMYGCSDASVKQAEHKVTGQPSPTRPTIEHKEFKLIGEVKKVDKEAREITIRHEKIAGFMEAMTMPFRIDDQEVLDEVQSGDQVEGKLQVEQDNGQTKDYRLVDLQVVKAALSPPLVLDLSGSAPQLRIKPKRLAPGDPVPDFAITGQDGKPFKISDLRGYVVVLTFIYTRCPLPDFCPYMDRKFSDLAMSISAFPERAAKIRLLSVSFDPDHDTPEILRKHARIRVRYRPSGLSPSPRTKNSPESRPRWGWSMAQGKMKSSTIFARRSSTRTAAWRGSKSAPRATSGHLLTFSRPSIRCFPSFRNNHASD